MELNNIVHERLHQRSVHVLTPTLLTLGRSPNVAVGVQVGLDRFSEPFGMSNLDEATIEMAKSRILLATDEDRRVGHLYATILHDGVVLETARKLNIDPQEVEFALYRGLFAEDDEAVAMIGEALGPQRTNMYLSLGHVTTEQAEIAANMLGLTDTEALLRDFASRRAASKSKDAAMGIDIYQWQ